MNAAAKKSFQVETTSPKAQAVDVPEAQEDDMSLPDKIVQWLRTNLNAEIVSVVPQARWRPAWFVEVKQGDRTLSLYIRGERVDIEPLFPLEHEMKMHKVMEEGGIPVPHLYGFCRDPLATIMERVDGDLDLSALDEAQRTKIMDQYLEAMARLHRLDLTPFIAAGAEMPSKKTDVAFTGIRAYERAYRVRKTKPNAFMEFCLQWMVRNPPKHEINPGVVLWDSGQFLHKDGRVTAAIDLELAHIGDPLMDLTGFQSRALMYGFGDIPTLLRRYEQLSGRTVDSEALQYYAFVWALTPQLAMHAAICNPGPRSDVMTYRFWCSKTNLRVIDWLGRRTGTRLEPLPVLGRASPVAEAFALLNRSLAGVTPADEGSNYELNKALLLAGHLQRFAEVGDQYTKDNLDDLEGLLGWRPTSADDGEKALEDFVLAAPAGADNALIRIFHRRLERERMILGPVGSPITQKQQLQIGG